MDKEKKKEYMKKYRERNKEKLDEQRRKYNEENKEKIKERKRRYRERNKEQIREKSKIQNKRYRENNKEKLKIRDRKYREKNKDKITESKRRYNEENKEEIKERKKRYRDKNKDKMREYRKKNKKRISECEKRYNEKNEDWLIVWRKNYSKKYYEKNRDRLLHRRHDLVKKYIETNKDKLDSDIFDGTMKKCWCCKQEKQKDRKYWMRSNGEIDGICGQCKQCINEKMIKRSKNDIGYKLRKIVSRAISSALKDNNSSKYGISILQKLPYTMQQLKDHIESLWESWMNWDNYGPIDLTCDTWQIDHKIPQSVFPYDSMDHPNFLKCWDLNNLQPMKAIDNIRKGKKIINKSEV